MQIQFHKIYPGAKNGLEKLPSHLFGSRIVRLLLPGGMLPERAVIWQ